MGSVAARRGKGNRAGAGKWGNMLGHWWTRWFGRREFSAPGGYRQLALVAYPLILMSATNVVMQFADRKFLGNSSTEEMAAALPGGIWYFTLFSFFLVTANFTGALVAQLFGAKKYHDCVCAAWSGFYFSLMASALIVTAVPALGYWIMNDFVDEALRQHAWVYFKALIPSGVFACLSAPFFSFYSGRGLTVPVAVVNVGICVANIFLDWVFIFGRWGVPRGGIFGAGLATSLSAGLGFLAAAALFFAADQGIYPTRTLRRFRGEYVLKLLKFGTPAGLQVLSDVGAFALIILIVGDLGPVPLAAMTVAFSINNLSFMPLLGVSDATAILCGQFIGRRQKKIASKVPYRSWRLALLYMLLTGAVYVSFPDLLTATFRPDESGGAISFAEVAKLSALVLSIAAMWNLADTVKFIFGGALRGAGDTHAVLLINTCCSWLVAMPGILLIVKVWKPHLAWVWIYLVFCTLLEGTLIFWRFRSGAWRRIKLVKNERDAAEVPFETLEKFQS